MRYPQEKFLLSSGSCLYVLALLIAGMPTTCHQAAFSLSINTFLYPKDLVKAAALEAAPYNKPSFYKRDVDNTLLIWIHGIDKLKTFTTTLNEIHQNIKFTVKIEKDGCLPFLDIMIYRKQDDTLGRSCIAYKPLFEYLWPSQSA